MIKFCQRMGWGMLAAVLEHMSDRLRAGARADLLGLAKVAYVKSRTARVLWENGYGSVRRVAEARVEDLVPVLLLVGFFFSFLTRETEWMGCVKGVEVDVMRLMLELAIGSTEETEDRTR